MREGPGPSLGDRSELLGPARSRTRTVLQRLSLHQPGTPTLGMVWAPSMHPPGFRVALPRPPCTALHSFRTCTRQDPTRPAPPAGLPRPPPPSIPQLKGKISITHVRVPSSDALGGQPKESKFSTNVGRSKLTLQEEWGDRVSGAVPPVREP